MFGLGTTELILILVIVVIFFGAGKLPDVGAGIAKGIKNFKKNLNDEKAPENPVIEAEKSSVSQPDKASETSKVESK